MTHQGLRQRHVAARRALFLVSTVLAVGMATPALAQNYRNLDENGVDIVRGDRVMSFVEGSIGSGEAELTLVRQNMSSAPTQWDALSFRKSGSTIEIGLPDQTIEQFTGVGNTWNSSRANGSRLVVISRAHYEYYAPDGTKIVFLNPTGGDAELQTDNFCSLAPIRVDQLQNDCWLLATMIVTPNGAATQVQWDYAGAPDGMGGTVYEWRLGSVSNSFGYSISFGYAENSVPWGSSPSPAWRRRVSALFENTAASPALQASVSYAYPSAGVVDFTDMAGQVWQLTGSSIRRPGEAAPSFVVTGGATVTSVTRDGITTNYARTTSGTTRTTTITGGASGDRIVTANLAIGRPTAITEGVVGGVGQTTSYSYDSYGRLTRITRPEGDYVQFTLDARGNATQTRRVGKTGSGLSDIVTSAVYLASCTNFLTCNLPISTTDARGGVTNFTYTPQGGLLTATGPAPSSGAPRPETRYTYTSVGGVQMPATASTCRAGQAPACVGTADETRATVTYDAHANVIASTTAAGDSSLSSTTTAAYNAKGDLVSVDGPLPGTGDTSYFRYDSARRQVGTIAPDPDAAGSRPRRAQRTTFDGAGRVVEVAQGTVTGTDTTAWAAFAPAQRATTLWSAGRKIRDELISASTVYRVTDYSYDARGRLECTAVRMNPATWVALPTSACAPGTVGSAGPDRISRNYYDAFGRVEKTRSAVGTTVEADQAVAAFSANGQVVSLIDGEGNRTAYEYDALDRLHRTYFPSPTTPGVTSTTDYEQLTYAAGGDVMARRLRDGTSIGYGYDALGRLITKDLPGSEPDTTYSWDLLGRMTGASQGGHTLSFAHDALGRNTSQTGPLGTVTYQYDIAGRRTRMSWADGLNIGYDWNVAGELTAIRENGAASGAGVLATYAYDALGRRTSITRGNGTVTTYGYDPASRLASLNQGLAGTTADLTLTFGYNPAHQIASRTRSNGSYAWEGASNVDRPYAANGLNQLTTSGSTALGYDARGNLTSSGSATYTYTSENMLATAPFGVTLGYDPLLRLYETSGGSITRFQYDGLNLIGEYDSAGDLQRRYVHGPGTDEPLVWYQGSGTSTRRWLHADERGSIIAVTGADGNLIPNGIYTYDEYGIPGGNAEGRFQYTGQTWLPEIGMYHYKARIYSPTLGRFLQTDPIGYSDGMNMYNYVRSDPVNHRDPTGMQCQLTVITNGKTGEEVGRNILCPSTTFVPYHMFAQRGGLVLGGAGGGGFGSGMQSTVQDASVTCGMAVINASAISSAGGIHYDTPTERGALRDWAHGRTATLRLGQDYLDRATAFFAQNPGQAVPLPSQAGDPSGSFRRRITFAGVRFSNYTAEPSMDGLLGVATVLFSRTGAAIGIWDNFDFDPGSRGDLIETAMADVRRGRSLWCGTSGSFPIRAGVAQ